MPRNYKMHVWEVQQSAQAILQFTKGKTLHDYATDWVLRSAVERQINKIGGALARLIVNDDPSARRIGGYGGILGWGKMLEPYDSPDEEREVWDFVQNNLPSLLEDTTAVLEEGPADQQARGKSQRRKNHSISGQTHPTNKKSLQTPPRQTPRRVRISSQRRLPS